MRKIALLASVLLVFTGVMISPRPSAACGSCTCQNIEKIIVNCAACDQQVTTWPPKMYI
jgi:hypothetical protein